MNYASPESILLSSRPDHTTSSPRIASSTHQSAHISIEFLTPAVPLTNSSPGRTITTSFKEAPIPPNTVESYQPATSSRPGPVFGIGNGVFRTLATGKYDQPSTFASPESFSVYSLYVRGHPNSTTIYSSFLPGRTSADSTEETPNPPNTVEPFLPATCSRPGPVFGSGNGVFRTPNIGKYNQTNGFASPESISVSSQRSLPLIHATLSTHQPQHHSVQNVASTEGISAPGRVITTSSEEASDPPSTVEPFQPATSSRPGPVLGVGDGVFRPPVTGKYNRQANPSPPDCIPTSSVEAARRTSDVIIYYQNVGGMNGLLDEYRLSALDHCYDVIVLTETWLDSRTVSSYVFGQGYEVFRCDRNANNSRKTTGGGVLVAVHSRLKARPIENDSWNSVEQVWVAIQLGDRQLHLGVVYVPPDRTRDLDYINTHCQSIAFVSESSTPSDDMVVLGDFNLTDIAWTPAHSGFMCPDHQRSSFHTGSVNLLDNYSTATLSQINHLMNENDRFLDLCFVSGHDTAPFISTAPSPMVKVVAHHPPLVIAIEANVIRDFISSPTVVSYDFRKADFRSIAEVLSDLDWNRILDSSDVNIAAQTFCHVLAYVIDRHVPKKVVKTGSRVPWMTDDLRSLRRKKKAALRRFTKFRTWSSKCYYVRLNYEYKRLSRFNFQCHQREVQRRLKLHPKSFWNYVNEQRKEVGLPSSMVFNGASGSTLYDICNMFSTKFASVFVNEQLPADLIDAAANNVPLANQTLSIIHVDHDTVSKAASQLKTSFKPGPDGIPAAFLKRNIACLLEPLVKIFQLSLSSGIFPACWKTSEMFPVYKKGSKRDVNNYRGITSLHAVAKLFELVVMEFLSAHCKQYLSSDQHGFTTGRSTTTNLLCFTSFITETMIIRAQTDAIYTDLTAAFDKLNHDIAIAKLDRLGVGGSLLSWFRSYLTERRLVVALGGYRSASFCAPSGIPQGSHLGPLIFLLYFNDVHFVIEGHRLSFADDLKIFLRICSVADCRHLQNQVNIFTEWCNINRLVVNPTKCSVITFSRKKQPIFFEYNMSGTPIERVHCIKDLGIMLDSQLTFSRHTSFVVDKASRTLGFVFKTAKNFTDIHCLKTLYCSLVRSTLEYGSAIWSPNYNNGCERVESVQRRFLRFALRRLPWRDPLRLPSYESRCQLIDLQPLRIRRDVTRALAVVDTLNGRIDCEAILQQMNINVQPRPLRNSLMLRLPFRRTNYGLSNAIDGLQRIFNRVASIFDFHLSRNVLRRRFSNFFAGRRN